MIILLKRSKVSCRRSSVITILRGKIVNGAHCAPLQNALILSSLLLCKMRNGPQGIMLNPSQPVSFAVPFMTGSASSSIPRTLSDPLRFHRKRGCRAKNILPARSAHNPANSNDRSLSSPAAGQLFELPSLSHLRFWADPAGISDCNDVVSFVRSFLQIVLLLSWFFSFLFRRFSEF